MADDDNVLRPEFGDAKLVIDRSHTSDPFCAHQYVTIRRNSRAVICRVCQRKVDPFDVLLDMAGDWERVTHQQQALERLAESIAELKREESNVKGRLRSAHKLGSPHARSKVFLDEVLRQLNEACDMRAIWAVHNYISNFKWLTAAEHKLIADAEFAAQQRADLTARNAPKRPRRVRVIKGGK